MRVFRDGRRAGAHPPLSRDAFVQAFSTMLLVSLATGCVYLGANLIGRADMRMALRVMGPMLIGDAVLDVPLVLLTVWAGHAGWARRWLPVVLCALAVAFLQVVWDTEVRVFVGAMPRARAFDKMANSLPIDLYNTGLLVAVIAFQAAYNREVDQRHALAAMGERERRASLAALRLQLNPHFLFNTMNALSSLVVVRRNADAETMIGQLSAFLRRVLATDPAALDRLDQEVALTEEYLSIEQVRFGERLAVEVSLPDALAHVVVPPFLLQPLVENAIKYAVTPARRTVTVRVAAAAEAGLLRLEVADDGGGAGGGMAGGTGVGLANVRERLALHYGAAATLDTGPVADGYRATIRLPLERAPG